MSLSRGERKREEHFWVIVSPGRVSSHVMQNPHLNTGTSMRTCRDFVWSEEGYQIAGSCEERENMSNR